MQRRLPKQWWDIVLDGGIYRVELDAVPYTHLPALRAAMYREADQRRVAVTTHKDPPSALLVQAWGDRLDTYSAPSLHGMEAVMAPVVPVAAPPRPRTHICDCGQGPFTHPLTCSIWAGTAPQDQPPTDQLPASVQDDEALLGPCTCGQSPRCLPNCARVGG
jgi:hypothetical protein